MRVAVVAAGVAVAAAVEAALAAAEFLEDTAEVER